MIKITKDNYKDMQFDGIIISVPKNNELDFEFNFHFECAYYSQGKHGYRKGYNPDNSSFFSCWYGDSELPHGLSFNSTSRLPWDKEYLHFNNVDYYKFKDMTEFCKWYLKQRQAHKGWVQEKCGTNLPPISVPEKPSKGNNVAEDKEDYGRLVNDLCHVQDLLLQRIRDTLPTSKGLRLEYQNNIASVQDTIDVLKYFKNED